MIPEKFQHQPSAIASYNFQDFTAGTGFITFYAGKMSGSNILSPNVFNSNSINTNEVITQTAYTKFIDLDFDVLFNQPQTIRGDAIVDVPCAFGNDAASATTSSVYISARIRKYNGSTETEIGEGSSPVWVSATGAAGVYNYNLRTCKVTIPKTQIAAGEYLRLTIEAWAKEAEANNHRIIIGHDPANRTFMDGEGYNIGWASGSSILKAQIPFDLDL